MAYAQLPNQRHGEVFFIAESTANTLPPAGNFDTVAGPVSISMAITEQQDRGDGNPVKESGRYSDREIAAWTDSLRYISWPLLLRDVEARLIGRSAGSSWTVI